MHDRRAGRRDFGSLEQLKLLLGQLGIRLAHCAKIGGASLKRGIQSDLAERKLGLPRQKLRQIALGAVGPQPHDRRAALHFVPFGDHDLLDDTALQMVDRLDESG